MTLQCPCPSPRKILTSSRTWRTRNDSSNVQQLLNPRLTLDVKLKGDVLKKHLLKGNNNCYCRCKSKNSPTLFKRPNTCIAHGGSKECICAPVPCDCDSSKLRFTKDRQLYEDYKRSSESVDLETILESQSLNTTVTNFTECPSSDEERSVPEFRKEHYFETHDIGKLKDICARECPHDCVHQFKMNAKDLPEAVNTDMFGRSLCKICAKTMKCSTANLSSFNGSRPSKTTLSNYCRAEQLNAPLKTINLGMGKSKIELLLTPNQVGKMAVENRVQKPIYKNSLALRHQKMRT